MSPESGDRNQQPDESSGEQSGSPLAGQRQDNGSGAQGKPSQSGAPPLDFMPPKPAPGAKWSARTGQSVPNLPPHLRAAMEETPVETVRTMLDHDALKGVVSRTFADKEGKVAELKMAQAAEPPKPFLPIENYRKATPCSSTWENPERKERVSFCEQCKCQVYDFTGLEMPEAEELIFKRENRRNAPLFKRKDGRFLTCDCPAGVKRQRDLILTIVGGSLVVVSLLVILMMMPPPPKPSPPPTVTTSATESTTAVKKPNSSSKEASTSTSSTGNAASDVRIAPNDLSQTWRPGSQSQTAVPAGQSQPGAQGSFPATNPAGQSAPLNLGVPAAGAPFGNAGSQVPGSSGAQITNSAPIQQQSPTPAPAGQVTTSETAQPSSTARGAQPAENAYVKNYR